MGCLCKGAPFFCFDNIKLFTNLITQYVNPTQITSLIRHQLFIFKTHAMKKLFTLFVCIVSSIANSYSQVTTTVSYSKVGLNTSICNALAITTPPVIGGLTHYPVSGGVRYGSDSSALRLVTRWSSNSKDNLGTAYAMAYPFKRGHNYTVEVTGTSPVPNGQANQRLIVSFGTSLPDPNDTNPSACGPVYNWVSIPIASMDVFPSGSNKSVKFTYDNFGADNNYLILVATGFTPRTDVDTLKITKVVITDNVPLSFSPTTISQTCGNAITPTFTVTNVNNVAGITAYKWNLSAAPNGWSYNGGPAPQFITTTSNSLTLTADVCSNVPIQNVSCKVEINGKDYAAGSATASVTNPGFSISGPSTVCTSSNFSVNNLVCGNSVSWSVWPPAVLNVTSNPDNTATASWVFDDKCTIYATVSGGCLTSPVTVSKEVVAGNSVDGYFTASPDGPSSPTPFPTSPTPTFSSLNFLAYYGHINTSGLSNISWSYYYDAPYAWQTYSDGFFLEHMTNGQLTWVVLDADGVCGHIHKEYAFLSMIRGSMSFSVSPNPARGQLTIRSGASAADPKTFKVNGLAANAKTSTKPEQIYAAKIMDLSGRVLKHIENRSGATPLNVSLAGIRSGYYLLSVFDGKTWSTKRVVVNE